jgi:hypothetical protein
MAVIVNLRAGLQQEDAMNSAPDSSAVPQGEAKAAEPAAIAPSPAPPPAPAPADSSPPAGAPNITTAPALVAAPRPTVRLIEPEPAVTLKERLMHAVPLAVLFIYWLVVACVGLKMEELFQDRHVGRLPSVTQSLLGCIHFCANVPAAFALIVIAISGGYLLWGAQSRERMRWTALLMQGVMVVVILVTLIALFAPMSMLGSGR